MDFFNKSEQSILLNANNIVVGFSGGADSTLALAATQQFLEKYGKKSDLTALHVNHQTQNDSINWQQHSESFCKKHKINFLSKTHLYGRLWGSKYEVPFLHFELCYYQAIE